MAMEHYVAYHNADKMGYADIEQMRVYTSKAVGPEMIGDHVWLVVGKGKTDKTYFLGCRFIIGEVAPSDIGDFKSQVSGGDGRVFGPMIPLEDLDWFENFRKDCQYFSLGLREIRDRRVVQEFEKLAASTAS